MCKPITLHQNKHGYISWCVQCNHINIAFGTIVFAVSTKQFEQFIKVVNTDVKEYENKVCCKEKSLMYSTDSHNVNMVLCYTELQVLADLLNNASIIYETQLILGQNE